MTHARPIRQRICLSAFGTLAVWSFGAVLLPGCLAVDNDRLVVGNIETLGMETHPRVDRPREPVALESITRENWEPMAFTVPVDTTLHTPAYAPLREPMDLTAAQRNEYPTLASAVPEYQEGSNALQVREALVEPVLSLVDAALIVPRMFLKRPWEAVESPSTDYQRRAPVRELPVGVWGVEGR